MDEFKKETFNKMIEHSKIIPGNKILPVVNILCEYIFDLQQRLEKLENEKLKLKKDP